MSILSTKSWEKLGFVGKMNLPEPQAVRPQLVLWEELV